MKKSGLTYNEQLIELIREQNVTVENLEKKFQVLIENRKPTLRNLKMLFRIASDLTEARKERNSLNKQLSRVMYSHSKALLTFKTYVNGNKNKKTKAIGTLHIVK